MRLFIAIKLPEAVKDKLEDSARLLERNCAAGRRMPRENYHITLAFLGEQPQERVERAAAALDACACRPFRAAVGGFGAFRQRGGAVLWRGIEAPEALEALARALASQLWRAGFALEERPFRPHLTLLRRAVLRPGVSLADLSARVERPAFPVEGMALLRSRLSAQGARYTTLYERRF